MTQYKSPGLPRFKLRIGWVYQYYIKGRMGLPRFTKGFLEPIQNISSLNLSPQTLSFQNLSATKLIKTKLIHYKTYQTTKLIHESKISNHWNVPGNQDKSKSRYKWRSQNREDMKALCASYDSVTLNTYQFNIASLFTDE